MLDKRAPSFGYGQKSDIAKYEFIYLVKVSRHHLINTTLPPSLQKHPNKDFRWDSVETTVHQLLTSINRTIQVWDSILSSKIRKI